MIQNGHVYAICCRPEVTGDVISGENVVKSTESYTVLNFEIASFSNLRDIKKKHFVTTAVEAYADIDDSTKRKRIRVSLNNLSIRCPLFYRNVCLGKSDQNKH